MFQRSFRQVGKGHSSLDRAIAASVLAMVTMNLFVLAQQVHALPQIAALPGAILA